MKIRKQNLKKLGMVVSGCAAVLLTTTQRIAAEAPTFDTGAAETTFNGFMDPFTTFLLFAIPGSTIVILLIFGLRWLLIFDDDEKEKKPFARFAKRVVIVAAVLLALDVLLKMVGIG